MYLLVSFKVGIIYLNSLAPLSEPEPPRFSWLRFRFRLQGKRSGDSDSVRSRVRKVARFSIFLNSELLFCEIFDCKE